MERIIVHRNGLPDLDLIKRGERSILNASLTRELLSSDFVTLKVKTCDILDVKVNDTIVIDGRTYRMNIPPEWLQKGERNYEYDLRFDGIMYDLVRTVFLNADGVGFSTTSEFALVGNIEHFLTAILNNVSRFSGNWQKGTFTNGETKTLTFSDENCLQALQKVCTEFGVEFRVDIVNGINKINIGNFGQEFPYSFSVGKGKGLYTLSLKNVDEKNIVNRLYVFGGTENLPVDYRNYSDKLRLPNADYMEDTTMIANMGLVEGIANFPDIYPKRKGKVTQFVDKTSFVDDTMNFDLNETNPDGSTKYLLPDTTAKISFLTGNLAGYEFEVSKKNGYTHATKTFKIVQQVNDKDFKIPDDTAAYQFAVGDEYVMLDIAMPPTYIADAEAELLEKGTEEFEKLKQAVVSYELKISPLYLKSLTNGITQIPFDIGDYIKIIHQKLNVNKLIRITSVEKNLLKDGEYTVTVADDFKINDIRQLIYDVTNIQTILTLTGVLNITKSMLGYKTTEELKNLVFDPDGYFSPENIRPNSIETNMLSVGAKSQQLSCSVTFSLNELGNPNQLSASMGQLFSQTMERLWNIGAQTYVVPDNDFRYVYAKCQKNGNQGVMYLTNAQILFDSDVNDYYFLIGVLHSVTSGVRIMSVTIGSTTINGGLIRTGRISSLDGSTYFDLNTNEIKGNITFNINSPAFEQIQNNLVLGIKNLIRNSGFNLLAGTFMNWGYGNLNIGLDGSYLGNNVVKMFLSSGTYGDLSQTIENVSANTNYEFIFEYKGKGEFYVVELKSDGTAVVNYQDHWTHLENVNWEKKTVKFTTQPDCAKFVMIFRSFESATPLYICRPSSFKSHVNQDWSPAPEDANDNMNYANTAAQNAQTAAQNAQNAANAANAMLSDISNDDKLTPVEKQALLIEWNTILTERPIIINQAAVYAVSTAAYDSYYNALYTYVTTNGLLADINTTSDITGSYFRQVFQDYYTAKVNLLKSISDKANQIATDAQNTANQANLTAQQTQQGLANVQVSINDIKTKTDNFTSIVGGLIMSNIISVGDNQLNQNAFLSGITDVGSDSIRFGAGANYANKNSAPFKVLDNGKMIASNADITGVINATSGNIGAWQITQTSLTSQTGRILFGTIDAFGQLSDGLMLSVDNYPNSSTIQNNFSVKSNKNLGNVYNYAAEIFSTGSNFQNIALSLGASGSTSGSNIALNLGSGKLMLDNNNGFSGINTYRTDNGKFTSGFTGNWNGRRFENGILVN